MGSTKVSQPAAPTVPTASQTATDYASALPIYYEAAMKYEPQMAALEKSINEQLYPNTAGLQETIAGQAQAGLTQDMPEWYKTQVGDTLKAQLGRNLVYNPQAQEQYGVATQQAYQDYGNYWRNLALSAAGRQPLATSPNIMQTYTPSANMNQASNTYGTQAGIYGQQMQNYTSQSQYNPWMNVVGSLAGGIGGAMTGQYMSGLGGKKTG